MPATSTHTHIRNNDNFEHPDTVRYEVDENGVLIQLSVGATGGQHMKFFYDVPGLQTAHQQLRLRNAHMVAAALDDADTEPHSAEEVSPPPTRDAPVTPSMSANPHVGGGLLLAPRRMPALQRGPSVAAGIQPLNFDTPLGTGSMWSSFMPTQPMPTAAASTENGAQVACSAILNVNRLGEDLEDAPTEIAESLEYVTVVSATSGLQEPQRDVSPVPTIIVTEDGAPDERRRGDDHFLPPTGIYNRGNRTDAVRQWVETNAGKCLPNGRSNTPVPNVLALAALGVSESGGSLSTISELHAYYGGAYQAGHTPGPSDAATKSEMPIGDDHNGATQRYLREGSCKENVDPTQWEMEMDSAPETPARKTVGQEEVAILTRSRAKARGIRL